MCVPPEPPVYYYMLVPGLCGDIIFLSNEHPIPTSYGLSVACGLAVEEEG